MPHNERSLDELKREYSKLRDKHLNETMKQLGWDLKILEELYGSQQKEIQDLQIRLSKAAQETMPDPDETLKRLIPHARRFSRARNMVIYEPDPFGPDDIQTDGPYIDESVPGISVPVCFVAETTILDTSAKHGAQIDYFEGSDQIASENSIFDETAGVNSAQFNFTAAGHKLNNQHHLEFRASFRFNFYPPENGQYVVRPTALLAGSWHISGGASKFPPNGGASMRISLRTRVSQSLPGPPPPIYAHNDVVLVDEASSFSDLNGVFKFRTPSNGETASVSVDLVQDLRAHIVVSCIVRVKLKGYGSILLNAAEQRSGLRVPEVHVDRLDCSQNVSLDDRVFEGTEDRRDKNKRSRNLPRQLEGRLYEENTRYPLRGMKTLLMRGDNRVLASARTTSQGEFHFELPIGLLDRIEREELRLSVRDVSSRELNSYLLSEVLEADRFLDLGLVIPGFLDKPYISMVSPLIVFPGSFVEIIGHNFGDNYGDALVTVGGREALVLEHDPQRLLVRIPPLPGELNPLKIQVGTQETIFSGTLELGELPFVSEPGSEGPPMTFIGSHDTLE